MGKRSQPSLSVMLPNYNHGKYVGRALAALVSQSVQPTEIVVIDDSSTDDSVEVIQSFAEKYHIIRFIRHRKNTGVLDILQRVPWELRSDYLFFASADDYITQGFFEEALAWAGRYPDIGLIYGKIRAVDVHNEELYTIGVHAWSEARRAAPDEWRKECLDKEAAGQSWVGSTLFRRQAFAEAGGFRTELGSWSDSFLARAVGLRHGVIYIPKVFMVWRIDRQSVSNSAARRPRQTMMMVDRAAALMRSPEFRDYFPEDHVKRWRRGYRLIVFEQFLLSLLPSSWLEMLSRSTLLRRLRRWTLAELAGKFS